MIAWPELPRSGGDGPDPRPGVGRMPLTARSSGSSATESASHQPKRISEGHDHRKPGLGRCRRPRCPTDQPDVRRGRPRIRPAQLLIGASGRRTLPPRVQGFPGRPVHPAGTLVPDLFCSRGIRVRSGCGTAGIRVRHGCDTQCDMQCDMRCGWCDAGLS